ncbi:MAG TPA: enoyl-CoA hydratase-related protein [Candidatus Nitrosocosmicus sp.]|uniref:enoyl-CoA hydratase/isomerase family protein n=1 Tax=Candidatus Nitrosocosmicus agrestis TaxID=2563600 RepID=UPI001E628C20|nr:enoyl-CoA hydratase-related protein [Candidatus Nitrosocosmicus sp. SS]MDR4489871.1 enoyl-CoA hydratase-related protein [Candidatus Nitrosocosmicus sp.]HET6588802.1 enoyl-CoA hydratase-related protein [Candidatus Nitrosocosmicus sp.]
MSSMKYVQIDLSSDIAVLKINRPEALNAMNLDVISELSRAIDIISADEGIKVLIITGAGERSFCAGADISYMVNIDAVTAERYASSAQNMLNKIEKMEKPVIAAINGFALGGGCELSLVCDIRFASENAKIGQPEATIGIPPGWGGTQRLLRVVGPAKAKEMIFTGKMISSHEAADIGLVNNVISLTDEEKSNLNSSVDENNEKERNIALSKLLNRKLLDYSINFAKEITRNSFNAVKISKMLINKGMDADIDTGLRLEIYGWALCFAHEDRHTMMSAFLNKSSKK